MAKISVHLLGRPYVEVDGQRVNFPYKKAEGFFYYLCVKKTATREEIIYVLWGADNENVGRKNLREAVYQIKKLLGKEILVTAGHTSISLNPEQMPEIDWDHVNDSNILENEEDGFLSHFLIKNSYEFEEWVVSMQEQYDQAIIKCAKERLYNADAVRDMDMIQKYGNILLKHDPYNEKLYYEIMDIYAVNGNYNMAIKLYYDLEKILADELGVEPSEEIKELFHRIFNVKGNTKVQNASWTTPFLGRTAEIYEISECIVGSGKCHHPQCTAICGDDGVGKSALLDKAKDIVRGYQMIPLCASCYKEEKDFFLRPWNDIFWEIEQCVENGILERSITEEEQQHLNRFFKGTIMEGEKPLGRLTYQLMEETILGVFRKLVEKHKIVLFFDDIQWMDAMSFQLLNRILLMLGTEHILLICTYNQAFDIEVMEALEKLMKKDYLDVIQLNPFTKDETKEILNKFLPQFKNDIFKFNSVYQMTDGNAFFLMELINSIKEKGFTLEKSQKTNNVIKARLAGLPDVENEVLDCMSLFPEKISIEEIELLLPSIDRLTLVRILEKLQDRRLIKEILVGWNVFYKFQHRVFREFIYERQSEGKRRMYHQILAEYYEAGAKGDTKFSTLPMVIHHYERSRNMVKAYQYKIEYLKEYYTLINENFPVIQWEIKHRDDSFESAFEAEELLDLAEEVIQFDEGSYQLQEMKKEMYYVKGRFDIAAGDYQSGISNIEESMKLAELLKDKQMLLNDFKQMIFYGIQVEDLSIVKQYIEEGLSLINIQELEERGIFTRLRGWYLLHSGEYKEAREVLREACSIFEACSNQDLGYTLSIAACYNYIGDTYRASEDYETALSYYKKAIDKGTGTIVTNGMGQFYSNMGQVYYILGNFNDAQVYLEQAIACFERHGYFWGLERAEAYMALVLLQKGMKAEAKAHYEKGVRLSEKINNPTTVSILNEIQMQEKF